MACQETTPMTSQKIPFLLYAPHHSAGYPGFQGLVPLARLSTACFSAFTIFQSSSLLSPEVCGSGFSMRFDYIPTLVLLFYVFLYFHWLFHCIVFITSLSDICLWFCNSAQDGCFFDFLCAGSLLIFIFFRRALGRVKNERKEETNHIGRKRRHICFLFALGGVLCLLLAIVRYYCNMKCFCVYLTLG